MEHGVPQVEATKHPKLDKVINSQLRKKTKVSNSEAMKLRTVIVDTVGPLAYILENTQRGLLTAKSAVSL